jgi:L-seryl-tRNA(Ser) seleniumtransferase
MNKGELFKKIPKVDEILADTRVEACLEECPRVTVMEMIRKALDGLREKIKNDEVNLDELEALIRNLPQVIEKDILKENDSHLKKVINATGTIIHTNLGRSLLAESAVEKVAEVARSYSNLEYNLEAGRRGSRYSHVEEVIQKITGAEAAMVVNNNASAVMLILSTMAKGKEAIVSRGELVEIGGSFRIPEVMEQSGAKLVEVGATNKTHARDYEKAITEETGVLLKVHTSNYRIMGFTDEVSLEELVEIGQKHDIPVIEDIGSGVLLNLEKYGLEHEPTVQESIKAGIEIVSFSGDKLLGGPQAGIIVGKKCYIDEMKKNPLTRAVRIDKFTIAALEETLKLYLDEKKVIEQIPTMKMATMTMEELEDKANGLFDTLKSENVDAEFRIVDQKSQIGGGAMPLSRLATKAIEINPSQISVASLEERLRNVEIPIIARVYQDRLLLDVRTIDVNSFEYIAKTFKEVLKKA